MSLYQDEMLKMADAHIKDLPLHIICALCNDGTQCNVYLEEFENRILEHVELKDFKNIGFVTCRKGFRSMGRVMVTHLCEILMNDTEIKFNEIFGKEWYSETDGHLIVQAIVNTFEDYFVNDFERDILEPEWLSLLTKLLIAKVCTLHIIFKDYMYIKLQFLFSLQSSISGHQALSGPTPAQATCQSTTRCWSSHAGRCAKAKAILLGT